MERSVSRLAVEAALGALGGALLATVLPGGGGRLLEFSVVGAVAAPLALLLTPGSGSVKYRSVRYGLALSVILTLLVSFVYGRQGMLVEELLAFGVVIFAIGAAGHAVMAATVDRAT